MIKISVCKTIAAHPQEPGFMCMLPNGVREPLTLEGLAMLIKRWLGGRGDYLIKNEVFGDIVALEGGDDHPDFEWECERLSRDEMHELARLL